MLQSFFGRLGRWNELPSSFEFTVGEEVALPFTLACNFLLFNCRRKSDDMPASVFVLYKKQPAALSCSCSSTGGCCNSCASGGATAAGAHRPSTAVAAALTAGTDVVQQGKQHMRRAKTLLHPDLLKVLQTYESDTAIYIVTERCWPLPLLPEWAAEEAKAATGESRNRSEQQNETTSDAQAASFTQYSGSMRAERRQNAAAVTAASEEASAAAAAKADVAWGLLQIANAVAFLQDSCHLVHGQVSPLSIFVTAAGSWKLSALELVRPFQQGEGSQTSTKRTGVNDQQQALQQLLEDQRRSAAYLQGWQPPDRWNSSMRLQWADWWGLASVLVWAYSTLGGRPAIVSHDNINRLTSRSDGSSHSYSSKSCSSGSRCSGNRYGISRYGDYDRNLFDLSAATVRETAPHVPPAARQFLQQLLSPAHQAPHGQHGSTWQSTRLSDLLKQTPFFSLNSTCNCMLFLREVHVKGAYEKETFFEKQLPRLLQPQQELQTEQQQFHSQEQALPLAVQQQQVLPELLKLLDPTTCTRTGSSSCSALLECASGSLTPAIVGCVAAIAAGMKSEEPSTSRHSFTGAAAGADLQVQRLRAVLEKLFKSRDRALRYTLLTSLDDFEPLMTRDLCEHAFNGVLLGLLDSTPVIREATIKALVVFCQKIARQTVLQTCLEQLRRLTEDPEVVLRTNACVCAAKICSLPETVSIVSRSEKLQQVQDTLQQLLAQVLLAAMRDCFPLCRVASLQSVQHALSAFPVRAVMLTLTPAVAAAAVDCELSVAEAAVCTLERLVAAAANATAERRAAACTPQTGNATGAAADVNGSGKAPEEQQAGGNSSSTLNKAAASLSDNATMNFGNGGWFGVVARRLRNSLGVAGTLSNTSCSDLQSTTAATPTSTYTINSGYGTSASCSNLDSISSSSTRPWSCNVNAPPPPPPTTNHPEGPAAAKEATSRVPCAGDSINNIAPTAAEKRRDSVLEMWTGGGVVADSMWDVKWKDACEITGIGLQNNGALSGGDTVYFGLPALLRQSGLKLLRGKHITADLASAASSAGSGAPIQAPAAEATSASIVAAVGGGRDRDLSANQGLRGHSAAVSVCIPSASSTAAGHSAGAGASARGAVVGSAPTLSNSSIKSAATGDDFFAEMERQLQEKNY